MSNYDQLCLKLLNLEPISLCQLYNVQITRQELETKTILKILISKTCFYIIFY